MKKLYDLKRATDCAMAHMIDGKDDKGVFIILACDSCDDKPFCLKLVKFIKRELRRE